MSKDVCLINMPYSSLTHPSLALGLIENYIKTFNHECDVVYGNLEFANVIGLREYDIIDNSFFEQLIGEWTFSRAAFPDKKNNDDEFFALFTDITDELKQQLHQVRDHAETYISVLSKRIIGNSPKVVACTSTFQQNCASLALLRMIKSLSPNTVTLLGGANCESIMGQTISENCPWVDYVFSGECDAVIGKFVDKLVRGENIGVHNLPHGFIAQGTSELLITNAAQNNVPPRGYIEDMSQVGAPIFDDYFDTIEALKLTDKIEVGLLAETSRGCWWGAKKHCTFCGLNGVSMEHRSKPADVVVEEFKLLSEKYNNFKFEVVDNILPMEYLNTVLPEFSKQQNYNIFYETKSNLKRAHVEQLANSGIKWIQPGFESLHDDFLKLIDKGVTGIQNVSALKWCRNYGISVIWNLLCGAPNEEPSWYNEIANTLPLISHLQPPNKEIIKIRYPRFSPYFKKPEKYGLTLEPLKSYQYIYPLDEEAIFNIAYFFDQKSSKTTNIFSLLSSQPQELAEHRLVQEKLDEWVASWITGAIPLLYMSDQNENIVIIDTRSVSTNFTHTLSGLSADIYRLCEEPVTKNRLKAKLSQLNNNVNDEEFNNCLQYLVDNNLLLSLSNCYLSLALKGQTPALPDQKDNPAGVLNLENC